MCLGPRTDTPVFEIDAVPDIDPDDVEGLYPTVKWIFFIATNIQV